MGARSPAIGAFGVAFAAMVVVALLQGAKPFYYDSSDYWFLGRTFVADGTFSLTNFDSALRGYLLPLVSHGLAGVADAFGVNHSLPARLLNAALLALIATVLLPSFAKLAWPEQRWGFWRRLGVAAVFLLFWRSYLSFPLSDFPALAAALLALIAAGRAESPPWMLVAGLATAAAINMRPAYVLVLPIVLGLVAARWWPQRAAWRRAVPRVAIGLVLLAVGFAAVSLPQSLSAHRHHDLWTFMPGAAEGLTSLQLTEGLRLQRYETYVGPGQAGPRMLYVDPVGERILAQRDDGAVQDFGEYAEVLVDHPIDMAGVFLRHVVNGLDQRYATPYVEELDSGSQRWLRAAGFLLVFLALVRVAWPAARRSLGPARWRYPVALLLCGAPALVSAVETRFLLPVVSLAYLMVLAPGWPNPLAARPTPRRRALRVAALLAGFAVYGVVVGYIATNATDNLQIGWNVSQR